MLVHSSPIFVDQASAIAELGREFRLPSIGLFPIYAKAGGLVSYGPNNFELFRQVGGIVAKIFRGAKPSEFPIPRPVCVPKIRFCHIDGEGRQGQVVRR
jgi:putative ABC transport system substrate-binding protein